MLFLTLILALLALLQDVAYSPVTPLGILASALLVPVIGFISSKLYDGLKTIIPAYDKLPSLVHQVAAPLFGLLFGFIASATGAELLTDLHGVSAGFIGAVLNALAMAGIKRWEKAKQPADATLVLQSSRGQNLRENYAAKPRARRSPTAAPGSGIEGGSWPPSTG